MTSSFSSKVVASGEVPGDMDDGSEDEALVEPDKPGESEAVIAESAGLVKTVS